MRKIIVLVLMALALVGCATQTQTITEANNENVRFAGIKGEVTIVTDNETGCKYIREQYGSGYGLTVGLAVLLKADGMPDCN